MRAFNDLGLLAKLAIPSVLVAGVSAGIVLTARANIATLSDATAGIVDVDAAGLVAALRAANGLTDSTIREKNMIIATDPARFADQRAKFDADRAQAASSLDDLSRLVRTAEDKAIVEDVRRKAATFYEVTERAIALAKDGDREAAVRVSVDEIPAKRVAALDGLNAVIVDGERRLAAAKEAGRELAARSTLTLTAFAAVGLGIAFALLALIGILGLAHPLKGITAALSRLASGDLDVAVAGADRRDEVGSLARSLQVFKDNALAARTLAAEREAEAGERLARAQRLEAAAASFESRVSLLTQGLAGAATEMEATARSMTGIAEDGNRQALSAASASEQTSANVQTVAAAAEEMSATVQEIVVQVNRSADVAGQARSRAQSMDATVQRLSGTAEGISSVAATIAGLASQTNLLALNATIEAARAGDAGRGFAVVASEVKELAGQTARATREIDARIAEIQAATREAVIDIQAFGQVIAEVAGYSTNVAAAMEEQGAATQEIARNVQQAAQGTEVVSQGIAGVREGASHTSAAAAQVLGAAQGLARDAEGLSREVSSFLADVKAA